MKHYYISDPTSENGFVEVTEAEFVALRGDDTTRPYANKVYRGVLSIEEVPEELQESVAAVVAARVERFGEYNKQDIPANELKTMIEGAI